MILPAEKETWFKDRSEIARRESGSILDYVRIIPPTGDNIRFTCSPGWVFTPAKGVLHRMNCKRRTCEDCGWFWAWRWRQALAKKADNDKVFNLPRSDKALTLTFAENVPYTTMRRILEWFWENLRRGYPGVEYWGVVEFNQAHTIPHLHFILAGAPYMELDYLDYCWRAAQKRAKLEHLAWNLRIEKIRKNIQAYFTKYVTKLLGGKDEIPRRENWGGRFVRYSRKFFPLPVNAMLAGQKFQDKLKANDDLDRVFWHVRKPLQSIHDFKIKARKMDNEIDRIINEPWDPVKDRARAAPLPAADLLTGVETILVSFDPEFNEDLYKRIAGYNRTNKTGRYGPAY